MTRTPRVAAVGIEDCMLLSSAPARRVYTDQRTKPLFRRRPGTILQWRHLPLGTHVTTLSGFCRIYPAFTMYNRHVSAKLPEVC
ncbi:hypothetical protein NPIL_92671 [Nephila pilipes]|uniref:Uncharacterized protein n=1 Tax=Nephila pilipes TaxID=299642 RepID=A0A8X6P818_NEPPI|nr:hypothetical protein NPIL_92671 [Nephila pilipes]